MKNLIDSLQKVLFPEYYGEESGIFDRIQEHLGESVAQRLGACLPETREALCLDLQAALAGDPAAKSLEEIARCYPGFYALTVYRLANALYRMDIPILPRQLAEQAHSVTGIDIHPGARIGSGFVIDHGTGVVIGETAVIGKNVTLYHGVTLGALSTRDAGALRGVKRHPTLEDDVTVYANATVLGGDTVIGRGSVIGANAFVTASVPPGTVVSVKHPELLLR